MNRTMLAGAMALALATTTMAAASAADGEVVVVTGDTVDTSGTDGDLAETLDSGWWFNRDQANTTNYEFTADGIVTDVEDGAGEKFIAENLLFQRVSEVGEISFDFVSDEADSEFYINVYVNHESEPSGGFYDCRYDYTGVTGTDGVRTVSTAGVADNVASSNDTDCPASLTDSPTDSFVRVYSINVGDTSALDLQSATIMSSTAAGVTYVFQAEQQMAVDISDCQDGGYEAFEFRNQGQCIASIKANGNAGK